MRLLNGKENSWAVGMLTDVLKESLSQKGLDFRGIVWSSAGVLGEIGDPQPIPTMIAVIDADNTYDTVYGVGYFGLGRLTGVKYDESHDGPWWREWWTKNKERFPAEVQAMEIPHLAKSGR